MNVSATHMPHTALTRALLAVVALAGAFLIALPLSTGLPGKSQASADLMSAFRPAMSDQALAQGAGDLQTMAAMSGDIQNGLMPAVATQLHLTGPQLTQYLATHYPAVAKLVASSPAIQQYFSSLHTTMAAQQANFQQADQIPTGFLPPTAMTWLFIGPGAILLVIGIVGVSRPRWGRALLAAAGVLGLVVVIGLLATSMYAKTSAADTMNTAFQPVFATQNVQQGQGYVATVQAAGTEMSQKLIPDLAAAFRMTPGQFDALLTAKYPQFASGVTALPAIVSRMDAATSNIASNVDNYNQTASIPWTPGSLVTMFWLMVGPAAAVFVISTGALLTSWRRPTSFITPQPHPLAH